MRGADSSIQKKFRGGGPSKSDFQLWKTCMTINQTWVYNANDRNFKPPRDLICDLVEVASRGEKFLLNVGPHPDGTIQKEFQDRLAAMHRQPHAAGHA